MTGLKKEFRALYTKDHNVLEEFYFPCIRNSATYVRVSGYFSSIIFDLASEAFLNFFSNGGKMKLVCSPQLTKSDAKALSDMDAKFSSDSKLLFQLLSEKKSRSTVEILCHLISSGLLELKLASLTDSNDLMHEKFGVFTSEQESVSFIGSINETGRGWGDQQNKESFNVFVSWEPRDAERISEHNSRFHRYWEDVIPGVNVRFPDNEFYQLVSEAADKGKEEFGRAISSAQATKGIPYTPLDYQAEVMQHWKDHDRRGMVQFCTGAGKTVVGLLAIQWAATQNKATLVIVPSKTLLYQWEKEIRKAFHTPRILKAGDGNNSWRKRGILEGFLRSGPEGASVVISTLATAATAEFLARASKQSNALFLGDEVHNFGAPKYSEVLRLDFKHRLGLSATPDRYGDEQGTAKLYSFFGQILEPIIDIPTAIKKGRLVPYVYDFSVAQLTDEEQAQWDELSRRISLMVARGFSKAPDSDAVFSNSDIQTLLVNRARIAKKAEAKISLALDIINQNYQPGQRWLLFLEDGQHVGQIRDGLDRIGLSYMRYEGDTPIVERQLIADHLEARGGIVLSMRCLDEGVDIPSISHAVILSSSQNPRQFVQRRGRVLRFAGQEKQRAFIWDVITMPKIDSADQTKSLILAEVARAIEFANFAENPSVKTRLEAMLAGYGLDVEECLKLEIEEQLVNE